MAGLRCPWRFLWFSSLLYSQLNIRMIQSSWRLELLLLRLHAFHLWQCGGGSEYYFISLLRNSFFLHYLFFIIHIHMHPFYTLVRFLTPFFPFLFPLSSNSPSLSFFLSLSLYHYLYVCVWSRWLLGFVPHTKEWDPVILIKIYYVFNMYTRGTYVSVCCYAMYMMYEKK